jgi:protein involved in polysaccharide export with SLBB domain
MLRICSFLLIVLPLVAQQPTVTPAQESDRYKLETGDTIAIKFFYDAEMNDTVQIRPDGYISMPMLGDLKAAGLPVDTMRQTLESRYQGILRDPAVTIQVSAYANRRIFVGGEVLHPGMLPLVGQQTALGAIVEAGGFRPTAKRGAVVLIRRGAEGLPTVTRLSMKSNRNNPADAVSFQLQPFDLLLVTESGIAKANRGVDQYIRQMVPGLLTGGFSYLSNASGLLVH